MKNQDPTELVSCLENWAWISLTVAAVALVVALVIFFRFDILKALKRHSQLARWLSLRKTAKKTVRLRRLGGAVGSANRTERLPKYHVGRTARRLGRGDT